MMLRSLICYSLIAQVSSQTVPALFVFGDSLVEVGNNNFLHTKAKANFLPYGVDYERASGRFSNGKCVIDIIGDMLGIPSPPPFADPTSVGSNILNGVNFASASSGILDETGQHLGDRYNMNQQVLNFNKTLDKYKTMMNATALDQYLAKSIAIMVTGSNDYLCNYLLPDLYGSSKNYTVPEFGNLLINNSMRQILDLYNLGLRKFFLAGLVPIGCIPNQRAKNPQGQCMDTVNQMVGFFNEGLKSMVDVLNKGRPDAIFLYGNNYAIFQDILKNAISYSFTVVDRACCGFGKLQGQISCLPLQYPCLSRDQFVFWDPFHPTQAAANVFASKVINGSQNECYPMNIKQMALK